MVSSKVGEGSKNITDKIVLQITAYFFWKNL